MHDTKLRPTGGSVRHRYVLRPAPVSSYILLYPLHSLAYGYSAWATHQLAIIGATLVFPIQYTNANVKMCNGPP